MWYLVKLQNPQSVNCGFSIDVGTDLSSRVASNQVLSARVSLTSVFGMGTGGPSPLITPTIYFPAPSKPNRDECLSSRLIRLHKFLFRSSPRAICTDQLNVLPHLHFRPIYDVVFISSYSFRMGDLILGGVSRLDAFSVYLVQT